MAITEEKTVEEKNLSFVEQLVEQDLAEGKNAGRIQTRFPPEPNGYLHIGHAKAICMDFGVAEKYNGVCNLRFDDTNPTKENNEYVENILNDISWLGFKWGNIYYASDYFEKLWDFAVWMIQNGHAYIDEQTAEQIAEQKGTPTTPGVASPYRDTWLLFTEPHFSDPNVFITREEHAFIGDPKDLRNESMVFPTGTAMEEFIRKEYPHFKIMTTSSELDAFKMVSNKQADIAMRSLVVAAYTIKKEGMFNLKIAGQLPDYTNQLRIGVIKTEPMLRDILDKGVATITSEDRNAIVSKYVSIKAQSVYDYRLVIKIIFGFILIGFLLLWRYYELKKYNQKLLYLSETDLLTKIYNRTKIDQALHDSIDTAKKTLIRL
jgi:hypothetical protein